MPRVRLRRIVQGCRASKTRLEGTFGEWLDELPFEVAAATARLLKHHARSGAWVELSPGNPSQASRAGRDRDRSSPNCPSDMSELSENSD